ncbi:DUF6204 family protein [Actinokineospora sp. 24-640]
MSEHTFRVMVRGRFDRLDKAVREKLLAEIDDHDLVFGASFTDEGTVTYGPNLTSFTFRVVVRAESGGNAEREVRELAERRMAAVLGALGCGYREPQFGITDMDEMRIRGRSR